VRVLARIEPLPVSEWPTEMRAALAALEPPARRHPLPQREGRPKALNALGTFARYPALAHAFNSFNGHVLFATTLTLRQREMAVLRVAARRAAPYEWSQHAVMGADVGLTAEQVDAIAGDPDTHDWPEGERALLQAVDELVADARISDETWADLARQFDHEQLMDLVFTVGAYETLAMAFNSFGVELDADLEPYRR
jgi:alkylhydroperoxidase family enzyme